MIDLHAIRFAKLNLDYDRNALLTEVTKLSSQFKSMPALDKWSRAHPRIFVGEQHELDEITTVDALHNVHQKIHSAWQGLSITCIPGEKFSYYGSNKIRNMSTSSWAWRTDVSAPVLKLITESLNFQEIHSVRIMMLPAGSIGLVHVDSTSDYYRNNVSITLNVSNGGSPIIFEEQGTQFSALQEPAFLFRDDCYHGVPRVSSNRIQIRINGKPSYSTLAPLVDLNSVVLTPPNA